MSIRVPSESARVAPADTVQCSATADGLTLLFSQIVFGMKHGLVFVNTQKGNFFHKLQKCELHERRTFLVGY